jgi:hypothetical protein
MLSSRSHAGFSYFPIFLPSWFLPLNKSQFIVSAVSNIQQVPATSDGQQCHILLGGRQPQERTWLRDKVHFVSMKDLAHFSHKSCGCMRLFSFCELGGRRYWFRKRQLLFPSHLRITRIVLLHGTKAAIDHQPAAGPPHLSINRTSEVRIMSFFSCCILNCISCYAPAWSTPHSQNNPGRTIVQVCPSKKN